MNRRVLGGTLIAAVGIAATARADAPKPHRLVMHVDINDAGVMELALGNIANAIAYFAEKHQLVSVELVANGPGYNMLRDSSPVAAKIAELHKAHPGVVFSACQNSRRGIAAHEGKKPEQIIELAEATDVPAGIARLMELQELGWSYVKV
jgi:intracellular sulfur oxidation DsrE/DsrF family protein